MNEITVFLDLTTNEALAKIEEEAKRHEGLYVDMSDGKQRKYVKDKAAGIKDLSKKIVRARIDKAKNYKLEVDTEAEEILGRLDAANKPFTLLIDGWADDRAKILAEEKRVNEEKLAAIQYDRDYDEAGQLNRLFDLEAKELAANLIIEEQAKVERERKIADDAATAAREEAAQLIVKQQAESAAREAAAKLAHEELLIRQQQESEAREAHAKQAILDAEANAAFAAEQAEIKLKLLAEQAEADKKLAIAEEIQRQEAETQAEADALAKREANKAHKGRINKKAMECFIKGGLSEDCAKQAVKLLANGVIDGVQINY